MSLDAKYISRTQTNSMSLNFLIPSDMSLVPKLFLRFKRDFPHMYITSPSYLLVTSWIMTNIIHTYK
ncbi:hypothetical protein F383_36743 [Gossypium arboreum]|uniref:Uncharacterized protein n=1 Tax=Gossypium arboreum TaxID=29729 RepID=A0A0B0NB19_GOSAR|nr:hypothetical protein F383_36743 [Gossypium arboreum]